MKNYSFWIILIAIGLSSCLNAQQPDNKKPMYGEVPKNEKFKKADEEFKEWCLGQFGTIDSAVQAHIAFGWEYFCYNDLETSMKRFNQAWLLDTECPDVYFAFSALMEAQGNTKEAERLDKIGHEKDVTKERAKVCYEQIQFCKEQWKRKKQWENEQKKRNDK
jgi:hypothetical protein